VTQPDQAQVEALSDVIEVRRVRMRRAGKKMFADVVITAPHTSTFEKTHALTEHVEQTTLAAVRTLSPHADID
jgi:divalent metal cation (Fe/Co/Zn/Cd) transporter